MLLWLWVACETEPEPEPGPFPLPSAEVQTPTETDGLQTYTLQDEGALLYVVLIAPEGSLGHSHLVRATGVRGTLEINSARAQSLSAQVAFPVSELQVDESAMRLHVGLEDDLTDANRESIAEHMWAEDQLHLEAFSEIQFTSTGVSGALPSPTLEGDMTIRGTTVAVSIPLQVVVAEEGLFLSGETTLRGSDFGVEPYEVGPFFNPDEMTLVVDLKGELDQ